jgi:ketosteroid isomerase-like protein
MLHRTLIPRIRTVLAIAFALGLGVAATWAHALPHPHPQKQLKQQIEEMEERWRAATLAGDVGAMDQLLSEDYVGISWTGQVNTKAMQLDRIRNRSLTIKRMDVSDQKVKLLGGVAIVTARADVDGSSEGSDMTGAFRYTRVYQRLPSGVWKITNFEVTRVPDASERHHHGAPTAAPAQ